MAKLKFNHSKITGVCTVVPADKIRLDDELEFYPDATKIARLKMVVGLNERRIAKKNTTPSDLMYDAAKHIINGMDLDTDGIDAIICVLDNPDYKCPPTSCILHGKLNLPNHCMAFDVNHGCAGYIYGLALAFSLVETNCNRVLLLVGDTKSHTINIKDRISAPIFGDGAAATIIERTSDMCESFFVFGTKGKDYENIMIPAGGARIPYSEQTAKETTDEFGNTRSLNNFRMNGKNVFDFTMNNVPQNIQDVIDFAKIDMGDINYFIMHQANKSIIHNILARLGVTDTNKIPTDALSKYGNLAVASVPSVMTCQLYDAIQNDKLTLLLSGFGVGLSYGSAVIKTDGIYCPETFIYNGEYNE